METNSLGIALIKKFEGSRLEVYKDIAGFLTVGVGHRCSLPEGTIITQEQADAFLRSDLVSAENDIKSCVSVDLTDNEFSALVSLVFNIGGPNFRSSTMLKFLNQNDKAGAANEFPKWDHAGGRVVQGLLARRLAERSLFLSS